MNEDEKYIFDLTGYLILRQLLTPDEHDPGAVPGLTSP